MITCKNGIKGIQAFHQLDYLVGSLPTLTCCEPMILIPEVSRWVRVVHRPAHQMLSQCQLLCKPKHVTEILITTNPSLLSSSCTPTVLRGERSSICSASCPDGPGQGLKVLCGQKYYRYKQTCGRINVSFWLFECSSFQKGRTLVSYRKLTLETSPSISVPAPLHFFGLPLPTGFIFLGQLFLTVRM